MEKLLEGINESLVGLVTGTIEALPGVAIAIGIIFLTRFLAKTSRTITGRIVEQFIRSRSLQQLAIQISYTSAWAIGILIASIIAFPDLELGDIVALLGLGSVAVGFAFQDIFKNFLAGVLLLLQEPFQIGDQIMVDSYEGVVEEIALRSTQIRTYQGEIIVVPNAIVFTSPVQVLTARPKRRTDLAIGVDYNTSLPLAVDTLFRAVQRIDAVFSDPMPEVDIVGFGDSAIDLVVRYWTLPEIENVRRTKTRVMIALKQACDEADINIPYPIRTVYFYNQEQFNDYLSSTSSSLR